MRAVDFTIIGTMRMDASVKNYLPTVESSINANDNNNKKRGILPTLHAPSQTLMALKENVPDDELHAAVATVICIATHSLSRWTVCVGGEWKKEKRRN